MKKISLITMMLVVAIAMASCKKNEEYKNEEYKVEKVILSTTSLELYEGETFQLSYTLEPSNATSRIVEWSSSDDTKATVSKKGLLTAKASGTAIIKVKVDDVEATCSLVIKKLIVGRWQSTTGNYFEVYNSDGTGKMWNEDDDIYEDEADTFEWSFENEDNSKFVQTIHFHSGAADLPQMCNIVTLNESSFVYNNNGWRRTENLKRIN